MSFDSILTYKTSDDFISIGVHKVCHYLFGQTGTVIS